MKAGWRLLGIIVLFTMTSSGYQPRGLWQEKQSKPILLTTKLLHILFKVWNILIQCVSPLIRKSYNHHTPKNVDSPYPENWAGEHWRAVNSKVLNSLKKKLSADDKYWFLSRRITGSTSSLLASFSDEIKEKCKSSTLSLLLFSGCVEGTQASHIDGHNCECHFWSNLAHQLF